jgi:hypothetical protein
MCDHDVIKDRKVGLSALIKRYQLKKPCLLCVSYISTSGVIFDILVEHGDNDILLFYMAAIPLRHIRINLEFVVQYCIKYSKKDILNCFLDTYGTNHNAPDGNIDIKEVIVSWMCLFSYQYNNMQYLDTSNINYYKALLGACTGNHLALVKEVLANHTFHFYYIQVCAALTNSLSIIQLLYPQNYISNYIFGHALGSEMYDVIDWIIDNNMELRFDAWSAATTESYDYLYHSLHRGVKSLIYLICVKKLKIKYNHIKGCTSNSITLLLLVHFGDCEITTRRNLVVEEHWFEQFLSMYPKCDRTKFKMLSCNNMSGYEYIEQYFIKKNMLHNEMKLLYDLPDDLCKQIL